MIPSISDLMSHFMLCFLNIYTSTTLLYSFWLSLSFKVISLQFTQNYRHCISSCDSSWPK